MKKSKDELINLLAASPVQMNQRWRHEKTGNIYLVDNVFVDCDTNDLIVGYRPCDRFSNMEGIYFCRPLSAFKEKFSRVEEVSLWLTHEDLKKIEGVLKKTDEVD